MQKPESTSLATRLSGRVLYLGALAALLLSITGASALAGVITGSGNWLDGSYYCGSGACILQTANLKSNVSFDRYLVTSSPPFKWVVYWQDFGGSVYPSFNANCGYLDWIKRSTYYSDDYGNQAISGWAEQATICSSGYKCRDYRSETDYWAYGYSPTGNFAASTSFTSRCTPPLGPEHYIQVHFQ